MWGLSDLADQQIAGVTMSVEQAAVFFFFAAYFVLRQLRAEEARETRTRTDLANCVNFLPEGLASAAGNP